MTDPTSAPQLSFDACTSIFAALPAAVAVVDQKYRVVYANAVFSTLTSAWPVGDAASPVADYMTVAQRTFAASDASALATAIDMMALGVTQVDLTYAFLLREELRTLVLTVRPIAFDGVGCALIHHMDITGHAQPGASDGQLRHEYDLAMHMLNAAGEGILTLNAETCISFANPAALAMLGWQAEELIGLPYTTIVDQVEPELAGQLNHTSATMPIRAALTLGQTSRVDSRPFKHKSGAPLPVEFICAPIRMQQDTIEGVVITFRDITERKRAEAEQRRLIAILDASTDMVSISDMDGRPMYLNRAGRKMMGFRDDDPIAQTIIADYHPEWALKKVMEEGIPGAIRDGWWSGETAIRGSSGQEIPLSQVILAHRDSEGNLEFLSTVARNISLLKQSEAILRSSIVQESQLRANEQVLAELLVPLLPLGDQSWLLPLVGRFSPERIQHMAATIAATLNGVKSGCLIVDLTSQQLDESLSAALQQIIAHAPGVRLGLVGAIAKDAAAQIASLPHDNLIVYEQLADALRTVLKG